MAGTATSADGGGVIPIVDLRAPEEEAVAQVGDAFREVGFFYLTGEYTAATTNTMCVEGKTRAEINSDKNRHNKSMCWPTSIHVSALLQSPLPLRTLRVLFLREQQGRPP